MKTAPKSTENISIELLEKANKKIMLLSQNKNYKGGVIKKGKLLVDIIQKSQNTKNIVTLEIPPDVLKKLGSGQVSITKGVARYRDGRIYKHLPEFRPSKVTKSITIISLAFLAIDALEDKVVDEKLKELLSIVKRLEAKVDAQDRGRYRSAVDQFIELGQYRNKVERNKRVSDVLSMLNHAENIYKERYEVLWEELDFAKDKYFSARISNNFGINKINKLRMELHDHLSIIMSCAISRIVIFLEFQKEFELAQTKSYELQLYLLDQISRFEENYGSGSQELYKDKHKNPASLILRKQVATFFKELSEDCNDTISSIYYLRDLLICFDLTIPILK